MLVYQRVVQALNPSKFQPGHFIPLVSISVKLTQIEDSESLWSQWPRRIELVDS